ncbi:MAG: hypothetical protein K2P95_07680, partial [Hyphomonadaceae bacterium]|nr:hypothetical protein [Hyphomonadaceae bacterium]
RKAVHMSELAIKGSCMTLAPSPQHLEPGRPLRVDIGPEELTLSIEAEATLRQFRSNHALFMDSFARALREDGAAFEDGRAKSSKPFAHAFSDACGVAFLARYRLVRESGAGGLRLEVLGLGVTGQTLRA